MMFGRLGVLNAFFTRCFQFMMCLLKSHPIVSQGSYVPSIMWVDLILSVDGLRRKKTEVVWQRGNLASREFWDSNCNINSSVNFQVLVFSADFGLADLYSHISQFLKTFFLFLCTHINTHTLIVLEKTNTYTVH